MLQGYVKLRWSDQHFPDHEVIVEIDNPNSIHAFNRSEEEGHAERIRMRRNKKFFSQNILYLMTGYKNLFT